MPSQRGEDNGASFSAMPNVAIIMGSNSDYPVMIAAGETLKSLHVSFEEWVMSAHRTQEITLTYVKDAVARGVKIFIAGAGGAAHLAGMIAGATTVPVIGVPIESKALKGLDSLFSIVQMPSGIPVATVAIDGAENAAILAAEMLAISDSTLKQRLQARRAKLAEGKPMKPFLPKPKGEKP